MSLCQVTTSIALLGDDAFATLEAARLAAADVAPPPESPPLHAAMIAAISTAPSAAAKAEKRAFICILFLRKGRNGQRGVGQHRAATEQS
jgi:hypothetical protein